MDIESVLVDEVVSHEGRSQVGSAEHHVPAGLRLELLDLLGYDLADHCGVPTGPIEGPGEHDLGHVPPDAGELDHGAGAGGVSVGCRPESGHQLMRDASAQEGAHRAELLVEVAVQLVIDHLPVELAVWSLDEPVNGHRHHQDDLSHRGSLRRFAASPEQLYICRNRESDSVGLSERPPPPVSASGRPAIPQFGVCVTPLAGSSAASVRWSGLLTSMVSTW